MVNYIKISLVVLIVSLGININAETKNHSNNTFGKSEAASAGKSNGVTDDYKLYQNFPNPFNPATIISYKLNQGGYVSLSVYNLVGQEVSNLVSEYQEAGTYSKQFDASSFSAGVYLYKLQVNGFTSVKRMTLIK